VSVLLPALLFSCGKDPGVPRLLSFSELTRVEIAGYTGHSMEPFLSPDGQVLLFNNLNAAPENTNLHWATRVDDLTFQYKGEIAGVNTSYLEGVPSLDQTGTLYFVSTRSYDQTLSSIYSASFSNGSVTALSLVGGISKNIPGWLNFDVDVDITGNYLYLVDGRFDAGGGPHDADIFIAQKAGTTFQRLSNDHLAGVNSGELEYAACISHDNLELYFTRVAAPLTSTSEPQIFGTTRKSTGDPFETAVKIEAALGFVEGPTLSPDGNRLYFHKLENGKFVIYSLIRTGL
jgi:hypothetical protein